MWWRWVVLQSEGEPDNDHTAGPAIIYQLIIMNRLANRILRYWVEYLQNHCKHLIKPDPLFLFKPTIRTQTNYYKLPQANSKKLMIIFQFCCNLPQSVGYSFYFFFHFKSNYCCVCPSILNWTFSFIPSGKIVDRMTDDLC